MLLNHFGEVIVAHDVRIEHEEQALLVLINQTVGSQANWPRRPHRLPLYQTLYLNVVLYKKVSVIGAKMFL